MSIGFAALERNALIRRMSFRRNQDWSHIRLMQSDGAISAIAELSCDLLSQYSTSHSTVFVSSVNAEYSGERTSPRKVCRPLIDG